MAVRTYNMAFFTGIYYGNLLTAPGK